ncbi:MAG: sulfatase-like hydrolase/transferase, partial [Boseongicola sp.]|nr:sulfatase-like hydrolase/transferase [Boseongicola sp.]
MIISLFFLTVSLVLLRRWASMRWVSWLVASSLLSVVVLTVVEFCLNLVTGDGVNGAVFYHMRTGLEGGDVSQYFLPLTVAAVILCGVVALTWVFRRQLYPRRQTSSLSMNGAVAVAALAAVLAHPVIVSSATYAVRFSLVEQQREGFHFVSDEPSRPDVPKNLVLIYLESVERSYLDSDRFPGLTPNLTALEKKAVSFSNLGQTAGAGFTVGGLVASQCGFPLILAGGANSMRVNQFLSGASCLGDILSNAGYHTLYLGGASTEFAGKGAFFDSHGYDEVLGLDELLPALPNQDYVAEWGLQDDTLLDIARTRFEELSSQDQPFGMALLTLDTHHPNGHAETNQACQGLQYRDGDNPMLNSVHCADALIGEFVSDIMSGPAAEDTVIAIASDHLAMVNSATDLLEAGPRRNLFMVIDSETLSDGQVVDRQGSIMDLGPTILTRLGFDVPNLGLGVDLLGAVETLPEALGVTVDNKKALDNHVMGFRDVYTRLWAFPDISEGLYVNSERGEVHFGHNAFSTPVLLAFDEDHTIEQAVLKDSQADETLSEAALNLPSGQRYIWIDKCATLLPDGHAQAGTMDDLCFFAGKRGNGANVLPVSDTRYYSAEDLEAMLGADPEGLDDTILLTGIGRRLGDLTETIALPALKTGHRGVLLQSSAFGAGASFVRRQTIDSLKAGEDWILERGVSLIGLKPDGRVEMIDRLDQCAEDFDANAHRPWAERITEMKDQFSAHIVAVHDTAFCGEPIKPLEIILGDLPVKELRSSKMREAYLGVITSDGDVFEVANRTFDRSRVFLSPKPNGGGSLSASARFEP